jgi:hypothetical protein
MKLGIELPKFQQWFGNFNVQFVCPEIKIGFFSNKYESERWLGLELNFKNAFYYEQYDYGWLLNIVLCGFGLSVNRVHL